MEAKEADSRGLLELVVGNLALLAMGNHYNMDNSTGSSWGHNPFVHGLRLL